jgi:hypothetical protein
METMFALMFLMALTMSGPLAKGVVKRECRTEKDCHSIFKCVSPVKAGKYFTLNHT